MLHFLFRLSCSTVAVLSLQEMHIQCLANVRWLQMRWMMGLVGKKWLIVRAISFIMTWRDMSYSSYEGKAMFCDILLPLWPHSSPLQSLAHTLSLSHSLGVLHAVCLRETWVKHEEESIQMGHFDISWSCVKHHNSLVNFVSEMGTLLNDTVIWIWFNQLPLKSHRTSGRESECERASMGRNKTDTKVCLVSKKSIYDCWSSIFRLTINMFDWLKRSKIMFCFYPRPKWLKYQSVLSKLKRE